MPHHKHEEDSNSNWIDPGAQEAHAIASAIAPQQMQIINAIVNIIGIVLGWFSIVLEVFLRFEFGERYLSLLRVYFAYVILSTIWFFTASTGLSNEMFSRFIVVFLLFSLGHMLRMWWRTNIIRKAWHSRSFGVSILLALLWDEPPSLPQFLDKFPLLRGLDQGIYRILYNDWLWYRFVEPLVCAVSGFILTLQVDVVLGAVILMASGALFIKNNIAFYQHRARIWDLIDAKIEGRYYNKASGVTAKQHMAGIPVANVVYPVFPEDTPARTEPSSDFNDTVEDVMG